MFDSLAFEEKQIHLRLEEIQLERRLNEIELERQEIQSWYKKEEESVESEIEDTPVYLHYSKSAMEKNIRIHDVCTDGTIYILGKNDAPIQTRKYTMRSLSWLKRKLPKFAEKQKYESNIWGTIAEMYSKQFTPISRTTIEQLCYFVDSGKCDFWFDKWNSLKDNDVQGTLD